MRISFQWETHGAGESKIRNFDLGTFRVNEQVARFEVAVHDAPLVAVHGTFDQLIEDTSYSIVRHWCLKLVQVLFHILIEVLEYKEKSIPGLTPMDNLLEIDDIWVVTELLQDCDLSDGCAWNTIVAMVDFDLFHSDLHACSELLCQVYNSVSALAQFRNICVLAGEFIRSNWRLIIAVISTGFVITLLLSSCLLGLFYPFRVVGFADFNRLCEVGLLRSTSLR